METHDRSASSAEIGANSPRKRQRLEKSSDIMQPGAFSSNADSKASPNPEIVLSDQSSKMPVDSQTNLVFPDDTPREPASQQQGLIDDQVRKEISCGITEYVGSDLKGFSGILKKRYTDFLVNEISPSGEVIHLVDLAPRKASSSATANSDRHHRSQVHTVNQVKATDGSKPEIVAGNSTSPSTREQPKGIPQAPTEGPSDSASLSQGDLMTWTKTEIVERDTTSANAASPVNLENSGMPDKLPDHLFPHQRTPVQSTKGPANSVEAAPTPKRRTYTAMLHETAEGWMEADKAKKKDTTKLRAAEGISSINDQMISIESPPQAHLSGPIPVNGEQKAQQGPVARNKAQWQAFAGYVPDDGEKMANFTLKPEDRDALVEHFGEEVATKIIALHKSVITEPGRKPTDYGAIVSGVIDRQARSKAHQDVRRIFNSRLETVTGSGGTITVTYAPASSYHSRAPNNERGNGQNQVREDRERGRGHGRGNMIRSGNDRSNRREQWANLGGDFLHFTLLKENKDTMEVISWLSRDLGLKASAFQFAGTKDRRGVTVQQVSIYRILAQNVARAGRSLRAAKVGNFEYKKDPLQLGELTGNEFTITLRDCDFLLNPATVDILLQQAKVCVHDLVDELMSHGFINYYGLQRFGTFSNSTDQVGLKMLQGDFEGAVNAILYFNPATLAAGQDQTNNNADKISREHQARAVAIHTFQVTGRSASALNDLPRKFSAEASLIRYLGGNNKQRDFFGALQTIPRNLRLMYLHAYQSLVWNMAASQRWKLHGKSVIPGDLVLVDEHKVKPGHGQKNNDIDEDGEAIVLPAEDDRAQDPDDIFIRARALTEEEAKSNKYTIFDIVLPTPGFDIIYPSNDIEIFYKEFMASERGGGLDPHDMHRKWKGISLSGSYRKIFARPLKNMNFDVKVYYEDNEDQPFVETDLDRLHKPKEEQEKLLHEDPMTTSVDPTNIRQRETTSANTVEDSKSQEIMQSYKKIKLATILYMQLGSSQYATMALRELMKHGGARAYKPDFGSGR